MSQHHLDQTNHEWAVILAGGDGARLKNLTRHIAGDERPKQFCSVLGHGTLLEETQRRVALQLAPDRTLYVVNRAHENFYSQPLAKQNAENLVVQPGNRGTAPAFLYGLLRIAREDPNAVVAFFPSDHYVSDNDFFMAQIRTALDTVHERLELVVLLGLDPNVPKSNTAGSNLACPLTSGIKYSACVAFGKNPAKCSRRCCNSAVAYGTASSWSRPCKCCSKSSTARSPSCTAPLPASQHTSVRSRNQGDRGDLPAIK